MYYELIAVLGCAVLCCAVLCCAVLCCAVLGLCAEKNLIQPYARDIPQGTLNTCRVIPSPPRVTPNSQPFHLRHHPSHTTAKVPTPEFSFPGKISRAGWNFNHSVLT